MGLRPEDARHFLRVEQLRADGALLLSRFDRDFPSGRTRYAIMQPRDAARLPGLRKGDVIEADVAHDSAFRPSRLQPIDNLTRIGLRNQPEIRRGPSPTRNHQRAA